MQIHVKKEKGHQLHYEYLTNDARDLGEVAIIVFVLFVQFGNNILFAT